MRANDGGEEKWKAFSCVWLFVALESPARILEWDAFPFSRGSSQPRDWSQISHIVGKFFTNWATREAYSGGESMFLIYSAANFLRPHGFKWEDLCETSIIINLL